MKCLAFWQPKLLRSYANAYTKLNGSQNHCFTSTSNEGMRRNLSSMAKNSGESGKIKDSLGIYVQTLPVARSGRNQNLQEGKILLCKWRSGDFKDRYTGLIIPLVGEKHQLLQQNWERRHEILLKAAKELVPPRLQDLISDIDLVGKLRFEDHPAYEEYIYIANIASESIDFRETICFGDHPCFWYDLKEIPFGEMPADDALWYPKVLWDNQKVKGSFYFGGWAEKTIKTYELRSVDQIE